MYEARARVFISCGQRHAGGESGIADGIRQGLADLGFDAYVAVSDHTLTGLRENIFRILEDSEYFIFVDFKRERLGSSIRNILRPPVYRGSLFSNQELGVASFLEKDALVFQEEGVLERDGLLSAVQANCLRFSRRDDLVDSVLNQVKGRLDSGAWSSSWRNLLQIGLADPKFQDASEWGNSSVVYRDFQLQVRNEHWTKAASYCHAFPKAIVRKSDNTNVLRDPVELKWSGYTFPYAMIPAGQSRKLDALCIVHSMPTFGGMRSHTDASSMMSFLNGPDSYEIEIQVVSANFPPATVTYVAVLGASIAEADIQL